MPEECKIEKDEQWRRKKESERESKKEDKKAKRGRGKMVWFLLEVREGKNESWVSHAG